MLTVLILCHISKEAIVQDFTTHTKSNSNQFVTVKVSIFSVVGSESWQTEISLGILYAYGRLPADLNYNAAEPEKEREVDCMEPFNSAVLLRSSLSLKHTVTTVAETDHHTVFRHTWEIFTKGARAHTYTYAHMLGECSFAGIS